MKTTQREKALIAFTAFFVADDFDVCPTHYAEIMGKLMMALEVSEAEDIMHHGNALIVDAIERIEAGLPVEEVETQ